MRLTTRGRVVISILWTALLVAVMALIHDRSVECDWRGNISPCHVVDTSSTVTNNN